MAARKRQTRPKRQATKPPASASEAPTRDETPSITPRRLLAVERGLDAGTMLDAPQLDWLYYLARSAPDGPAVEVGVAKGGSVLCWSMARDGRGDVYAVDSFYGNRESATRERFLANVESTNIVLLEEDSTRAAESFVDGDVAFVFIDACHDESPGIADDWRAWLPKVAVGGYIVAHDYGTVKCPAVSSVIDSWWNGQARYGGAWLRKGVVGSAIAFQRLA